MGQGSRELGADLDGARGKGVSTQVSLDDDNTEGAVPTGVGAGVGEAKGEAAITEEELAAFIQKAKWNIARNPLWVIAFLWQCVANPVAWQWDCVNQVYQELQGSSLLDFIATIKNDESLVFTRWKEWLNVQGEVTKEILIERLDKKISEDLPDLSWAHTQYHSLCGVSLDNTIALEQLATLACEYYKVTKKWIIDRCPTPARVNASIQVTVNAECYELQAFATLGDGSCGFYSLFPKDLYPRRTACEAVLASKDNATCCALLAPEIVAAIRLGDWAMKGDEFKALKVRLNKDCAPAEVEQLERVGDICSISYCLCCLCQVRAK